MPSTTTTATPTITRRKNAPTTLEPPLPGVDGEKLVPPDVDLPLLEERPLENPLEPLEERPLDPLLERPDEKLWPLPGRACASPTNERAKEGTLDEPWSCGAGAKATSALTTAAKIHTARRRNP